MSKHYFEWNLPADYDQYETEVHVRFSFHPGNGWLSRRPENPNYDPPVVEDVEVHRIELHPTSASGGCDDPEITDELPADVLAKAEAACWEHMKEKEPQR